MFRLAAIRPCKAKNKQTNKKTQEILDSLLKIRNLNCLVQYIMYVATNPQYLHVEKKNMFIIVLIFDKRFMVGVEIILC